jgi:hypothetical protein
VIQDKRKKIVTDLHFTIKQQLLFQLSPEFFDQLRALGIDDALLSLLNNTKIQTDNQSSS